MLVALCRFDLRIPASNSLKEKRHVVKTLIASIRSKYNVSVAEVDHQELWQRCALGMAAVANEGFHLRKVISEVERHIGTFPAVELLDTTLSLHGPDD